eukprot:11177806-Lingulodinium_polyedra.AAC.1
MFQPSVAVPAFSVFADQPGSAVEAPAFMPDGALPVGATVAMPLQVLNRCVGTGCGVASVVL